MLVPAIVARQSIVYSPVVVGELTRQCYLRHGNIVTMPTIRLQTLYTHHEVQRYSDKKYSVEATVVASITAKTKSLYVM